MSEPSPAHPPHAFSPSRRFDAVFCDVDGCLAPEGQTPADLSALAHVARHQRLAVERRDRPVIVPCTGRPQAYCEAVCRFLGLGHEAGSLPAICEHGVWLYDFAQHRWERDPAITDQHVDAVRHLERWVGHHLGPEGCSMQLGKSAAVTIFHERVDWLSTVVVPMLHTVIEDNAWPMRVSMTWTCINVDLAHVSKGRAIQRVIERFGLARARLAGIGDTASDLAIRDNVAWFGCPSNAAAEIKPRADRVATVAECAGVVELLETLVG